MKNLIASFTIFIIMVAGIVVSLNYLNKKCDYYSKVTTSLEDTVNTNSWDKAYSISTKFLDDWKKDSRVMSSYINHFHMESINNDVLKLTQYIENKDKSEALAIIHEVKFLLEEISNMEKITLYNIL